MKKFKTCVLFEDFFLMGYTRQYTWEQFVTLNGYPGFKTDHEAFMLGFSRKTVWSRDKQVELIEKCKLS